jgi:hypothetical protein
LLVTASIVAKRLWANRAIRRGEFGPVHRNFGRAPKVELAYAEQALGPFPPESLRAAGLSVLRTEVS